MSLSGCWVSHHEIQTPNVSPSEALQFVHTLFYSHAKCISQNAKQQKKTDFFRLQFNGDIIAFQHIKLQCIIIYPLQGETFEL